MAINRFITAGVALASAGAIAAIPAIAPPLAPREIQVAKSTEVSLNALVTDPFLAGLIDVFFEGGTTAVSQTLLDLVTSGDTKAQIDAFFEGGISQLVELRLLMSTSDPEQQAWIRKFFDEVPDDAGDPNFPQFGASGVVYKFLSERGLSTDQQEALDIFFNLGTCETEEGVETCVGSSNPALFGFFGLLREALLNSTTDTGQQALITDFFDGGTTLVVQNALLNSTADPGQEQLINDFFGGGASQVAWRGLYNSTTDPQQQEDLNTFFNFTPPDGEPVSDNPSQFGVSGLFFNRLVDATEEGTPQRDIVNQFFTNGISGVVNYILTGSTVPEPEPEPVAPESTLLSATSTDPVESDPVDTTVVSKKSAPEVKAAPAVAPAAAPVAEPAPEATPKFTAKIKEKATEETEEADLTDGNKVEPIIIETGGAKAGEGGFGVFGEIAGAIGRFVTGQGAPKSPTTATTTDTTSSSTDGESAG